MSSRTFAQRRSRRLAAAAVAVSLVLAPHAPGWQQEPPMAASQPTKTNRLAAAASPYLLQHAHNPVDWYEWCPEALEKARREDKPVFLSIGYAACHWCHVMAHESFENHAIAAVMNESFVCIKVDREERPDLDDVYMQATQLLNHGHGGWPMSVWLTPDLKPFFAGTYFPPESRWGRPGFGELCQRIAALWKSDRPAIEQQAAELTRAVRQSLQPAADADAPLDPGLLLRTAEQLAAVFDSVHGGVSGGGTNKFPPHMAMQIMLRVASRRPPDDPLRKKLEQLVTLTHRKMARGGIYDHLGGGIARYSVDVEWHVPHFEKMLYDQALVSRSYIDLFVYTADEFYANVARDMFDYVLADLQSPGGGFYSSRDADSEGEEGRFYVWTKQEILDVLGRADGELVCAYFDVSEAGNWQDPHAPGVPRNVLRVPHDVETVAERSNVDPGALRRVIADARPKLFAARARRAAPGLDDKILCEWNGLMIAALARGGAVLEEEKYVNAAEKAADFLLTTQLRNGRLLRASRGGRTLDVAFLSDYANLIEGLLELYEATFEPRWLAAALHLNAKTRELFWDERVGAYFNTPHDHETLIARPRDIRDSAVPSGNSVQLMNLLRLSVMTGDARLREMAARLISAFTAELASNPWSSERFLAAVDFAHTGPVEIAVIGDPARADTRSLLQTARRSYLPDRVLMLRDPAAPRESGASGIDVAALPLLKDRPLVEGRPAAYVCRNYACLRPATTPADLRAQLTITPAAGP